MRIPAYDKYAIPFNKEHTNYYSPITGELVPSVTQILKIINKEALIGWANMLGWKRKKVKDVLDNTSMIGSMVHDYCNFALTNNEKMLAQFETDLMHLEYDHDFNAVHNGIISFTSWYNEYKNELEVLHCELEMHGEYYGGTSDLVCNFKNKLIMIDYKTSSDYYYTMYLQLVAYLKLYQKLYNKTVDDVGVLLLDKKHGTQGKLLMLSDIPYGNIGYYYRIFETACTLFRNINVLEEDWKDLKKIKRGM